jgi:flagellar assembly protein FliH
MPAPGVKFTFDLDLGRREEKSGPQLSEAAVAALVEDARTAAYAEGFTAGEQSVTAKAAMQLAAGAQAIGDRVAAFAAEFDDMRKATLAESVDLAVAVAQKLAATLIGQHPTAEIETLVSECLATLDGVPHLVIRCHVGLADTVREIADARMRESGFAGRLVVMGEPDIALGDCRLEWVDGGIARDRTALSVKVEERIASFLASRGIKDGASYAGETD